MTDDAVSWNRLAALLPETEAQEVKDCWAIGEQEAGLGLLVSGILGHQVPISETVKAQISVLAETWGERETLTRRLLQCRDDDTPSFVRLIEDDGSTVPEAAEGDGQDLAGLALVPWISCTRSGRALMRTHVRESWGGLSYLARHYVITAPDRATVLELFPAGSAGPAFAALMRMAR
ncbi:hypothetical protein [Streptomyces mobaraensis]|uniref:Uncharacterized protein n=1 Tax=Streptomyces mobaraensis TaxID=35621 RepID=A0A5N5W110_STRMB|nr:hypothetical protein [Streptomyces mobaraensis]KAB7835489.1 hypothetical protein FRZ00_26695 [Streptomyces mobaraensis]